MEAPDFAISIYTDALLLSRRNKQTVGEKNDYYITVEQLESLLKQFVEVRYPLK